MIKSFRLQLTAWYLLLFTLVFVLFGVLLYHLLAQALYQRLDDTLFSRARTVIQVFQSEVAESNGDAYAGARETFSELGERSVLAAIFEGRRLLAASAPIRHREFTDLAARSATQAKPVLITTGAASGFRSLAYPFSLNGRQFVVLISQSLDPVAADLRLVQRIFRIALPLAVAIAGLGGFLLSTRSLAPVRSMAAQAKRITDRNLRNGLDAGAASEEFRVLADSFNELLARLDRSFATMRRFVADASHELRTPLAIIRGEADVALAADRPAAEYKESIAIIQDEARRLSRLVDDLLNLARVDADSVKLQIEPFYLDDLVSECCRSLQPLANAKGVTLGCQCPQDVMFSGDQELLRRLMLNLLENAIRYTPVAGRVWVDLEVDDAALRIKVSDTGIGIPPEAAPHVFERFYRVDSARSREQGGFGLGLSIVKWIAESHHGTVELTSQPGAGSTFTVRLPHHSPMAAAPQGVGVRQASSG
jgi:two-component system, OmpR family, sensor kinase